jgi:hypothetical protein
MKHTNKRILAREILILFSCVISILLVWTIMWTINKININKSETIHNQINSITKKMDSINDQISIDSFEEIFEGKIPKKISEENKKDPLHLNFNDFAIIAEDFNAKKGNAIPIKVIPHPREIIFNLHLLRSILIESGFQFDENKTGETPNITFFDQSILMEINSEVIDNENLSKTKPYLYRIYNFLLEKKYLNVGFYEFYMELVEKPHLPPFSESWMENYKLREKEKKGLISSKAKIYNTAELNKAARSIGILILIVIYPFRLLSLLLLWSVKTLRQKQS